jgi:tetrahydromethanopterin S-methyltransferase subunit B
MTAEFFYGLAVGCAVSALLCLAAAILDSIQEID